MSIFEIYFVYKRYAVNYIVNTKGYFTVSKLFLKFDIIMVEGYSDFEVLYQRTFILTIQYMLTRQIVSYDDLNYF